MSGIVKRFAGVTALDGVDLELLRGEVHALVGENGAGKSTLVKIMTGAYHRDGGQLVVEGAPVTFDTPAAAQAAGVIAVHQEIHLLGYRSVAENVSWGASRAAGVRGLARMYAEAGRVLDDLGLEIDPRATLGALSTAAQQMVAIARGVSLGAACSSATSPPARSPSARSRSSTRSSGGCRRRARRSSTSATASTSCTPCATASPCCATGGS
jgi:ribose transport system ATP-binding protein